MTVETATQKALSRADMERQHVQHRSSGLPKQNCSKASQQSRRLPDRIPVRRLVLALLEQMLRYRPIAFWSVVAMVPMLLAVVSVTALMAPEYAAQPSSLPSLNTSDSDEALAPVPALPSEASPAPVGDARSQTIALSSPLTPTPSSTTASTTTPTAGNGLEASLPLWSLGAIVLACAVGSVMVSQRLSRPKPRPRLIREVTSPPIAKAPAKPQASSQALSFQAVSFRTASFQAVPFQQKTAPSTLNHLDPVEPVVATATIVSPEDNHPLDWEQDSLVEAMDIRKRRSLSSWL